MPLGLMPDMHYEERETFLAPGDTILLYSDGLVEAHNTEREMFSFPRLMRLMGERIGGAQLIDFLLGQLASFTGPGWEQEDDVTLVALERAATVKESGAVRFLAAGQEDELEEEDGADWKTLDHFTVASEVGNERAVIQRVSSAVTGIQLPNRQLEQLKTAVGGSGNECHGARQPLPARSTHRRGSAGLGLSCGGAHQR